MPVRIYDIAKKLGIESKDVIAKAKVLGISAAKVPSSSLDKITAEYLEEQLGGAAPAPATTPAPPVRFAEPIVITAPQEFRPPSPARTVTVSSGDAAPAAAPEPAAPAPISGAPPEGPAPAAPP